ncbi:DUF6334 family protein [uncultured Robinsoniella sp.]|uniref:DUF6334 family protein n=1 Tax=uncultured Robinsoniella sp. TaxID=904190 RepID=UPI00374F8778
MINIQNLLGERIIKILCVTDNQKTSGYDRIIMVFRDCYIILSVDIQSDEIEITITNVCQETEAFQPKWSNAFIQHKLADVWEMKNINGYNDSICFGFDFSLPTLLFSCAASEIKVGTIVYT